MIQVNSIIKYCCLWFYLLFDQLLYLYLIGQKLIVAGSSNGTLQGADCNSEFYQPFKFLSSGSSRCVYEKSYCSGEGQVVFTNGTLENDRSCRCDYTRGYDFVNKPRHRCYCAPSEEDCSCHLKLCQSNYILSPGMQVQELYCKLFKGHLFQIF